MQKNTRLFTKLNVAVLSLIIGTGYVNAQEPVGRTVNQTDGKTASKPADATGASASSLKPPLQTTPTTEYDPTMNHEVFEDFLNGSNNTPLEKINQLANAGGGTGQGWGYSSTYEDAWGVIEARHGTGPYSRLDLVGKTPNMYYLALGIGTAYEYQVRFNFATLSTPTNRYVTFDGFFDGDAIDPDFSRGILFRYSDDINNGQFQIVIRYSYDAETLIDTGIAPVTDTWYRLKICVNATGTEALFYINGVQVATVTDFPIGVTNRYTAESDNDRLSGTTPFVSRRFDYVRFRATAGRGSRL